MGTVNLVIKIDDKKIIERYGDSDSAINRFEEAKHLNGVKSLLMTFTDGSSWSWKDNEMKIQRQVSGIDSLLADASRRSRETDVGKGMDMDYTRDYGD